MKNQLIILITIFTILKTNAQQKETVSFQLSKPYKNEILGYYDAKMFLYGSKPILDIYGTNFEFSKDLNFEKIIQKEYPAPHRILDIKGNVVMEYFNLKNNNFNLKTQSVDLSNNLLKNDEKSIYSTPAKLVNVLGAQRKIIQGLSYSKSQNNNFSAYFINNADKSNNLIGKLIVLNNKAEIVLNKEIATNYTRIDLLMLNKVNLIEDDICDFVIDNDGNCSFLVKVHKDKAVFSDIDNKTKLKNISYDVFSISLSGQTSVNHVDDKNLLIKNLRLSLNNDNEMVLAGFYDKQDDKGKYNTMVNESDGLFYSIIKKDKKSTIKEIPFSKELLSKYESDKKKKKFENSNELIVYNTTVADIVISKNNDIYIFGERGRPGASGSFGNSVQVATPTTTTLREEIIVYKLSKEGNLLWEQKIPKMQRWTLVSYNMPSYNFIETDGYLHFFFMDNIENLTITEDKEPIPCNDDEGELMCVTVDKTSGKENKQLLYKRTNETMKNIIEISEGEKVGNKIYLDIKTRGNKERYLGLISVQ